MHIHPSQFHRVIRGAFQAEHPDHFLALHGHPKTAVPFAVVSLDTIYFFHQCTLNIRLEGTAEPSRAEQPKTEMNNSRTWAASRSAKGQMATSVPTSSSADARRGGTWVRRKLGRALTRSHQPRSVSQRPNRLAPSGASRKSANIGAAWRSAKLTLGPASHADSPVS